MRPDAFVKALKTVCRDNSVQGCVEAFSKPPGRKPSQQLARISEWFNALSADDRAMVIAAMREAADLTLFNLLCVLDGVVAVEPAGEKSEFRLLATRHGKQTQISPNAEQLHDLLRREP